MMKSSALVSAILFSSLCVSIAEANLPPLRTLKEKVESAKYIFTGVAEKVRVTKIQISDVYRTTKYTSRNSPPLPPGPYRLIEFEVRINEVLKNGGCQLPKKMKLKLVRAFLSQHDMQRDLAEITATLSGTNQIYLVERVDLFSAEVITQKSQIKSLIQSARIKAKPSAIRE